MKQNNWLLIPLISLLFIALAVQEPRALVVGLGVVLPGGGAAAQGKLVVAPNLALSLGLVGLSLDLWFAPGNSNFYLFPYFTLNLPLPLIKIYGGAGPAIEVGATGLVLTPPWLQLNVKAGASFYGLPLIIAYGEAVAALAPLQGSISALSLVLGARVGF